MKARSQWLIKASSALFLIVVSGCIMSGCGRKSVVASGKNEVASTGNTQTEIVIETTEYTDPTIVVEQVEAKPGETADVKIHLENSPGIATCRLIVEFDNENMELLSYAYGEAFAEDGEEPATLSSPVPFTWCKLENFEGDGMFAELTFKVKDDVDAPRIFPVAIKYAASDLIDIDENEVEFVVENGSISTIK